MKKVITIVAMAVMIAAGTYALNSSVNATSTTAHACADRGC